ncbi:MAG: hypothetical protein QM783_13750 [Phycisphaerales bacterium]
MPTPGAHPALRLVGTGVASSPRAMSHGNTAVRLADGPAPSPRRLAAAAREVASENHSAALSALDPRWALAVRTNSLLQGGRAAILPPESRKFLVSLAKDINLRPFDANLVIAIVQDAARAGHDPLGVDARTRLTMVPEPKKVDDRPVLRWLIGCCCWARWARGS